MTSFAKYIENERPDASHTQIARELGVSRVYVGMLIRGDRTPGRAMMMKIEEWSDGEVSLYDWGGRDEDQAVSGRDTGEVAEATPRQGARDLHRQLRLPLGAVEGDSPPPQDE